MYLDTDILLALIKPTDWLKPYVKISKIKKPKISTLSIIEAEIVIVREYGRSNIFQIDDRLKKLKITVLELDYKVLKKSLELMKKYPALNIFDSVHAAFSIIYNEELLSTDIIFNTIGEIKKIDPRDIK